MLFNWADCDLCESLVEGHSHISAKCRHYMRGTDCNICFPIHECAECGTGYRGYAVFEGNEVIRPLVCSYCLELEGWFS